MITGKWHSIKAGDYPEREGEYLVTMEEAGKETEPVKARRIAAIAAYYGKRSWGIREGVYRIVAWMELPEIYNEE